MERRSGLWGRRKLVGSSKLLVEAHTPRACEEPITLGEVRYVTQQSDSAMVEHIHDRVDDMERVSLDEKIMKYTVAENNVYRAAYSLAHFLGIGGKEASDLR
jgi:hypothetical protein